MEVARDTLDWALREMHGPEGGFYSALDADSEGEEGRFYVWTEDEARSALETDGIASEEIERLLGYWGVSAAGNFEGSNVLHVPSEHRQSRLRGSPTPAASCSRRASSASAPASTTSASHRGTR